MQDSVKRIDEHIAEILRKEANHEPTGHAYAHLRGEINEAKRFLEELWDSTPENK